MDWDLSTVWGWLHTPWMSIGETDITLARVAGLLFILVFVWWFSITLENGLRRVALHGRTPETSATVYAYTRLVRYIVWVGSELIIARPGRTTSQLLWALEEELTKRGIEIPYPRRDIRIRSGALDVATARHPDAAEGRLSGAGEARA